MTKTIGDYIVVILSIVASIAGLVGFYQTYYQDLNDQGKYGVLFLGVISMWFLSANIYTILTTRKKIGYSKVFEELNLGFSALHSIDRDIWDLKLDAKEINNRVDSVCTHVSNAFSAVKGHHIGVCIKLLSEGNDKRARVFTSNRDEKSSQKRAVGEKDAVEHWVSENSDFQFIYDKIGSNTGFHYYFKNNLPYSFDYSNTRLKAHPGWPPKLWLFRHWFWELGYRSTIVVPIIPLKYAQAEKDQLAGFLCIDSPQYSAFNKDYDVEILKGIADGLYNKIKRLQSLLTNGENPSHR